MTTSNAYGQAYLQTSFYSAVVPMCEEPQITPEDKKYLDAFLNDVLGVNPEAATKTQKLVAHGVLFTFADAEEDRDAYLKNILNEEKEHKSDIESYVQEHNLPKDEKGYMQAIKEYKNVPVLS